MDRASGSAQVGEVIDGSYDGSRHLERRIFASLRVFPIKKKKKTVAVILLTAERAIVRSRHIKCCRGCSRYMFGCIRLRDCHARLLEISVFSVISVICRTLWWIWLTCGRVIFIEPLNVVRCLLYLGINSTKTNESIRRTIEKSSFSMYGISASWWNLSFLGLKGTSFKYRLTTCWWWNYTHSNYLFIRHLQIKEKKKIEAITEIPLSSSCYSS